MWIARRKEISITTTAGGGIIAGLLGFWFILARGKIGVFIVWTRGRGTEMVNDGGRQIIVIVISHATVVI